MSRYIDAEKLKAENRKHFPLLSLRCELNHIINEIPPADVVEVVRCKDCIHNHEHETPFGSKYHICNINNLAFTQYADFYCAYGERREDGI